MRIIPFFLRYLYYFKFYSLLPQVPLFIHHSHTTSTYHVVLYTVHFLSLSYFQLVYQKGVFARSLGSMSRCSPKRTPIPHVTILPVTRSQSLHPALGYHPPPPTSVFPSANYGKWGNTSPVLSSRGLI